MRPVLLFDLSGAPEGNFPGGETPHTGVALDSGRASLKDMSLHIRGVYEEDEVHAWSKVKPLFSSTTVCEHPRPFRYPLNHQSICPSWR